MSKINAYAADAAGKPLHPFEYEPGPLGPDDVEIDVRYCGICYSDVSMLENHWGMSTYPLVAGHEVAGTVAAIGDRVTNVEPGDRVGLGWSSSSCMACPACLAGDHNFCAHSEATVVGRHGGFADRVRCHWSWAIPIPGRLDLKSAGPLFCGGSTVFNPIVQFGIKPTDRVGVVGIGGLGHMAIMFLAKWGCHVTAFTSSPEKADEARQFGAHAVLDSRSDEALTAAARSFDYVLVTANVTLNWPLFLGTLRTKGRLNFVGAVLEPISLPVFALLVGQLSVSASPVGSPTTAMQMLDFCERHGIAPQIEVFPMSRVNEALDHLKAGKARYRVVLENDF